MSDNLVLEQLRLIRRETADLRTLTVQTLDYMKRIEWRVEELRMEARLDVMSDHGRPHICPDGGWMS